MTPWDAGRIMVLAAAGVLALAALVVGLTWLLDAGDFLDRDGDGDAGEDNRDYDEGKRNP